LLRALRHSLRLIAIARILARHDALFTLERLGVAPFAVAIGRLVAKRDKDSRPGQRLAKGLVACGPSFIKLGQALATRADLLGDEITADLSDLQDRLPPYPAAVARQAIEDEFEIPLATLFAHFEDTPVAAASIAQVHFARTSDGREVAVKVLRPGIEDAFEADLDLFRWVAEMIERTRPGLRRLKPVAVVQTLAESVDLEMDLRFEAAAATELSDNFEGDPDFRVPEVDWARTGRRVLTTERLSGIRLDDRDALVADGHDPLVVIEKAAQASFRQVFRDGFFHADVHPGNMFVLADGAIGAVDFGIMGRIDLKTRRALAEMLVAFLSRDYKRAAEVHFEAGWVPRHRSVEAFTQACRSIAEPIMDRPQNEISMARLLGQLFQITETFQMEAQPQLLLLQKTMLVAEGTSRKLAPEANMWLLARPMMEDWVIQNLGPEARIMDAAQGLADAAERLPRMLDSIEASTSVLAEGRVRLDPEMVRELQGGERRSNALPTIWIVAMFLLFAFFVVGK